MTALAVTLTVEELRALVREAVIEAVGPRKATEMMTREAVAELLDVHPRVVATYVRKRGLPGVQIGRTWRFVRAEVVAWIEAQGVKPGAPTAAWGAKLKRAKGVSA